MMIESISSDKVLIWMRQNNTAQNNWNIILNLQAADHKVERLS